MWGCQNKHNSNTPMGPALVLPEKQNSHTNNCTVPILQLNITVQLSNKDSPTEWQHSLLYTGLSFVSGLGLNNTTVFIIIQKSLRDQLSINCPPVVSGNITLMRLRGPDDADDLRCLWSPENPIWFLKVLTDWRNSQDLRVLRFLLVC